MQLTAQTNFAGMGAADSVGSGFKTISDVNIVVDNNFTESSGEMYYDNTSSSATLTFKTDNVFRSNRRTTTSRGLLFLRLIEQAVISAPASYKEIVNQNHG